MSLRTTDVVIVGAGQAGLAMSKHLTDLDVEHVLLERSRVASSWHDRRWDSLRLLTPNWMTRLPGHGYEGEKPDGFMKAREVARFLDGYARSIAAPVVDEAGVTRIDSSESGHVTTTSNGVWASRAVVIATGTSNTPHIPALTREIPGRVNQIHASGYRNPETVDGPTLVVGASASGVQIADELARHGREVVVAVGDHVRATRTYRGMDLFWWLEATGRMAEGIGDVEDLPRARSLPSLQLAGGAREVDLNHLTARGVQLVGRLVGSTGARLQFSGSLANYCRSADLKLGRMLDDFDEYATAHGLDNELDAPSRPRRTQIPDPRIDLPIDRFSNVVWATGYRPSYPWLDSSLLDRKGEIAHTGGVMRRPGMYVLGLQFLRTRKSSFIDGVGVDARDLSSHLKSHLDSISAATRPVRR